MSFENDDGRDLATQNMLNTEDEFDQQTKSQNLNLSPKKEKERQYYADWIRALAIHFVIMVHCTQLSMEATDISSPETYARVPYNEEIIQKARGFIKSLVQIGVPLFFYVSGLSLTYFDTQRKGFIVFAKSKFVRLIVPFLIGLVVILVPRLYFAQDYQLFARPYPEDQDYIENNYFKYTYLILPHIWKKLSWLWFLPALYIGTMINYPLLAWSQRRAKGEPFEASKDIPIIGGQLIAFGIWIFPSFLAQGDSGKTDLIPMVFIMIFFYGLYFLLQMLLKLENGHKYGILIKCIGIVACFALNGYRDGNNQETVYGLLTMIDYDMLFMANGMLDGLYAKEMQRCYDDNSKTLLMPLCFMGYGLNLALDTPTIYKNEGFLFFYPLYIPWWAQNFHCLGSFYYIYFLAWYMKTMSNDKFNNNVYNVIVGGSMWAYLSHYLWIVLMAYYIVRPYKLDFSVAAPVTWMGTEVLVVLSDYAVKCLFKMFGKGNKKKQKSQSSPRVN